MADSNHSRRGGRYCVAGAPNKVSCMNTMFTPGIRMHQFPSDENVRRKWVKFVQRHRHDFGEPLSKYTSLCSAHFDESCYERRYSGMLTDENKMKVVLRKGSVPTIDSTSIQKTETVTKRQKRQVRSDTYSVKTQVYKL